MIYKGKNKDAVELAADEWLLAAIDRAMEGNDYAGRNDCARALLDAIIADVDAGQVSILQHNYRTAMLWITSEQRKWLDEKAKEHGYPSGLALARALLLNFSDNG